MCRNRNLVRGVTTIAPQIWCLLRVIKMQLFLQDQQLWPLLLCQWASKSGYNLRENRGVPSNEYEGWMGLLEVSEQEDIVKPCIKLAQADEQGEEFVPLNQQAMTSANANKWIASEQEDLQPIKDKCSFVESVPSASKKLLKGKSLYGVKGNEKNKVVKAENGNGINKIDQSAYMQDVLARFNATEGRASRVPVSAGVYLAACGQNEPSDLNDEQIKLYQAIVGSLMYAATHTRPDISYAVSHLGKFLHKPASRHFAAAKTLLDNNRATVHLGLVYRREHCKVGANRNIAVVGYSDSNFASDQDRHSVGAYLFTMDGNAISWAARRINCKNLCISTEEEELTAASEATREAIALRSMCIQIGILNTNQPIVLNIDNSPAVAAIGK